MIWCPRYRRGLLVGKIKDRLENIIEEAVVDKESKIIALEIMPDHVHLSVSVPPKIAPHNVLKAVKGRSSNLLRKEFPELLKMPTP
jgi:putative transposase